jgi:hypothetical protein
MSYLNSQSWITAKFLGNAQGSYYSNCILVSEEQGFYMGQYILVG